MNTILLFFLTAFIGITSLQAEVRNLNDLKQDFILCTKKLEIPGYPEAFNPSIVRWKEKLLLSFRTYDPVTRSSDLMGLVWLDEDFNILSKPVLLEREGEITCEQSQAKDPRLIVVGEELFIVYSNVYPFDEPVSRMFVGKIELEKDETFKVSYPSPIIHYDKEIRARKEKNWVPFVFENTLVLAYSLQPHRLFIPQLDSNSCTLLDSTIGLINWNWGVLRGGTPALLVDGRYLAFFHSDKALTSVQSGSVCMNHYFMGAYTFHAEYPFGISAISKHPIVDKTFYEGPMYNTWKPLRVIFPGGYVVKDENIWLAYGRQDHEVWLVKMDKNKLFNSLKPVTTVKPPL